MRREAVKSRFSKNRFFFRGERKYVLKDLTNFVTKKSFLYSCIQTN